jgi:predicted MFS family arabinose efflux permease
VLSLSMQAKRLRHIAINRSFALLWSGQSISEIGSRITRDGLPIVAVLTLGATPFQMSWLAALGSLPILFVGLFAGALVDQLSRRLVMIVTDIGRTIILATIPIAAILGVLGFIQLAVVTILAGTLTIFFEAAYRSYLPSLVPAEKIIHANSKLGTSESIAEIIGPSLTGIFVQTITAPIAITFDALSFLWSAGCISQIRTRELQSKPVTKVDIWSDIRAGWKVTFADPLLRSLALSNSTMSLFHGAFFAFYQLYVMRELHISPAIYGLLVTMGGIGALVGALLTPHVIRQMGAGLAMIVMLSSMAVTNALTSLAGGPTWLILILLACSQLFGDCAHVSYFIMDMSVRQTRTSPEFLGRVNASMHTLTEGTLPISAIVMGFLSTWIDIRILLLIGAIGTLFSALILILSPVRSLRQID